jgi:amidase
LSSGILKYFVNFFVRRKLLLNAEEGQLLCLHWRYVPHTPARNDSSTYARPARISIMELAEAHIAQIERLNPALNAITDFDAERVREMARGLEAQAMSGGAIGALHGLPVTVKSSIATEGFRCEIGSTLNRGFVATEDAEVVRRLREAGALILGTTNCPEFLMAYESANLLHGRTANPWDLERSAGGSSGGESAAIAAGLSAAGLGSDAGGSVRQPAHCTGICALKPTPGRIPVRGHMPPNIGPFSTIAAIGPMTRTIGDLSLMFRVLAGQDPIQAGSAPIALDADALDGKKLDELRGMTIGVFEDDGVVPVTPETRAAVRSAAEALRDAGFRVESFRPKSLEALRKLWWKLFVQCGAMFYEPTIRGRRDELSPIFSDFMKRSDGMTPLSSVDVLNAWAELDLLRAVTLEELQSHPILLCPVASIPAFKHGERSWLVEGQALNYLDETRFTQWFNVLANPAVVLPVGRSPEGLPIGVQLAGLPYQDEKVLAIAEILERSFGYEAPPMARNN